MKQYSIDTKIKPIKFVSNILFILDQRQLPLTSEWITCNNYSDVIKSIQNMLIRGAPAIGIAASYGFYLGIYNFIKENKFTQNSLLIFANKIKKELDLSRPTAINLMYATTRMLNTLQNNLLIKNIQPNTITKNLLKEAQNIHNEDKELCIKMCSVATNFIEKNIAKTKYSILTHCNTGALATGGIGTALGVIRILNSIDKIDTIYVDETRPYLQGSRLTTYELQKEKINFKLNIDSAAAFLMQQNKIDFVIVGADRITKSGDVANKIGTYSLSILAKEHNIPFYVIAPETTFDLSLNSGSEIPIEIRDTKEITHYKDIEITPKKINVINYSFDITPYKNITAIFSENGVYKP